MLINLYSIKSESISDLIVNASPFDTLITSRMTFFAGWPIASNQRSRDRHTVSLDASCRESTVLMSLAHDAGSSGVSEGGDGGDGEESEEKDLKQGL